jgi:hypothetical protein
MVTLWNDFPVGRNYNKVGKYEGQKFERKKQAGESEG